MMSSLRFRFLLAMTILHRLQHYSGDRCEVFVFGPTCINPWNSEICR